jgi:all-trans-retinol 13,14-reductase
MSKSIIIIGSGLGGLSCGVLMAKNGYKVTVLEQGLQIGGCLQCFARRGVRFETGMHFIGSADKGQTLSRLLNLLELSEDRLELNRLDTTAYDTISLNGEKFKFANGREPFLEQMSSYFPKEADNLVRYFDLIEKLAQASSLHSLRHAETDLTASSEYMMRSINEVIDSYFDDEMLRSVLVGNLPLYAGEKDKTPFSTHAYIADFYNQSAFRVVGGSDRIAVELKKTIEKYGGEVLTKKKVTKIVCDETHATGVTTSDECFYAADYIISTAHPTRTMEMLDTKLIRPAFRNRLMNLRNTTAGFSVYLHFKKDRVPFMNTNYYSYAGNTPWNCEIYDEESWPKGYLYMHFCHEKNPKFAESGVILSYMTMDDVAEWSDTTIGRRGEDYKAFKERKAKKLLASLEKEFPGICDCIEYYYTSTPLTYRDYTGTEGGSMYGVAKDISLGISNRAPHRTRVPNLYLSGQNINSHGILGVLVGTIVTCSEFLTSEEIYKQIIASNEI